MHVKIEKSLITPNTENDKWRKTAVNSTTTCPRVTKRVSAQQHVNNLIVMQEKKFNN